MNKFGKRTLIGASVAAVGIVLVLWKYQDFVVIPKARTQVVAFLADPGSAQFRNERVTRSGVVCGELNAKNAMGGYAGFKRYIYAGPASVYLEGQEPLNGWSEADTARRFEEEARIFVRLVDLKKESPESPMPSQEAIRNIAESGFFDIKWKDLCETKDKGL